MATARQMTTKALDYPANFKSRDMATISASIWVL
jgi:hypothetical protein